MLPLLYMTITNNLISHVFLPTTKHLELNEEWLDDYYCNINKISR